MLSNLENTDQLIAVAQENNLYKKLVQQLNKDLRQATIDEEFSKTILPEDLTIKLHELIYQLIHEKFNEYLSLLYIIDVPEQKVKELDSSDMVKLAEQVAFLILKREWQKVWYRNMYK